MKPKDILRKLQSLSSVAPRAFYVASSLVIFTIASVLVWRSYVSPRLSTRYEPNCEFTDTCKTDLTGDTATLYYFYTVWCPHCKSADPEIKSLDEWLSGRILNGKTVTVERVDCDKDKSLSDEFEITGYPTVILVTGQNKVTFDAKPTFHSLREFVTSST